MSFFHPTDYPQASSSNMQAMTTSMQQQHNADRQQQQQQQHAMSTSTSVAGSRSATPALSSVHASGAYSGNNNTNNNNASAASSSSSTLMNPFLGGPSAFGMGHMGTLSSAAAMLTANNNGNAMPTSGSSNSSSGGHSTPSSAANSTTGSTADHQYHHHTASGSMLSSLHSQEQQQCATVPFANLDKNTLWMGDLDPWMDESYMKQVWMQFGEPVNVKVIRDKFTGQSSGYCFVEFVDNRAATKALLTLNGTNLPGTNKFFKLNWASGGGLTDKKDTSGMEFSIFVGDLGPEVNDFLLHTTFLQHYPSCHTAKVVTDPTTGLSRGYGFVRFIDEAEQKSAMHEMQGQYCGARPMRISVATPKNRVGGGCWSAVPGTWSAPNMYHDPSNTTVFVGGLVNGYVSEEDLSNAFAPFGPVSYVKIPPGKGCGFVSYVHRQSAEQAIAQLNGAIIGANRIRLSWGRNSAVGTTMQQGGAANMMPMGMGMTGGSMGGYRQHGHPAPASLHMQHAQQQHQMYYGNGGAQWAEEGAMAYGQAIAASGVQQSHHAPPSLQQHQQQPSRVVAMEYGHPASSSTGFAQPTPTSASVSPFAHPFFGAGLPSASSTTASAASSRALLPPGTKSAFSSVAPSTAASTLGRSTSSSPLPLASPEKLITPSSSPFDSRSTAGSPDSRSAPTSLEGGDSIWRTDASLFSMEMSFAPLMKHQAYTSASATVAKPTAAKRDEGDKPSGEKQDQASVDRADDDKKQREQTYLHDDHLIDALVDGLNATAFE